MGFGHRVYKNYDPGEDHPEYLDESSRRPSTTRWSRSPASWRNGRSTTTTSPRASSTRTSTSTRGSSTRRWTSRPTCSRRCSPSPDLRLGRPVDGDADDPDTKIARPRQIYTGERELEYVAVGDRDGPGENRRSAGPPAETASPGRLARSAGDWGPVSRPAWKLTVRNGPEVEHSFEDSTRPSRRCARGRWRSAARAGQAGQRAAAGSSPATGRGAAAAERRGRLSQAGRRRRRPRRRQLRPLRRGVAREELDPPTTTRLSTWCARLWRERADERQGQQTQRDPRRAATPRATGCGSRTAPSRR